MEEGPGRAVVDGSAVAVSVGRQAERALNKRRRAQTVAKRPALPNQLDLTTLADLENNKRGSLACYYGSSGLSRFTSDCQSACLSCEV